MVTTNCGVCESQAEVFLPVLQRSPLAFQLDAGEYLSVKSVSGLPPGWEAYGVDSGHNLAAIEVYPKGVGPFDVSVSLVGPSCEAICRFRGEAVSPPAAAWESELDFGRVVGGTTATRVLRVHNRTSVPVMVKANVRGEGFGLAADIMTGIRLGPLAWEQTLVSFTPSRAGDARGVVEVVVEEAVVSEVLLVGRGSGQPGLPPFIESGPVWWSPLWVDTRIVWLRNESTVELPLALDGGQLEVSILENWSWSCPRYGRFTARTDASMVPPRGQVPVRLDFGFIPSFVYDVCLLQWRIDGVLLETEFIYTPERVFFEDRFEDNYSIPTAIVFDGGTEAVFEMSAKNYQVVSYPRLEFQDAGTRIEPDWQSRVTTAARPISLRLHRAPDAGPNHLLLNLSGYFSPYWVLIVP